ncbi:MAG TPA: GNAT family N-acetyltransferase [Burkholderiaceae bacterium]
MPITALAPADTPPYELLLEADPSKEAIAAYLRPEATFVLREDGAVMGIYVLTSEDGAAEIRNLAVAAAHRNRGFGALLLADAIARARRAGANTLTIATGNSSIGQLYLYQKMGFEMAELQRDYFTQRYAAPLFENGIACRHRLVLRMAL